MKLITRHIASLATSSVERVRLAEIANVVLADLLHELREHRLRNEVIADMFGLTPPPVPPQGLALIRETARRRS